MSSILRIVWISAVVGAVLLLFEYKQEVPVRQQAAPRGSPRTLVLRPGLPLWQSLPIIAAELDVPLESLEVAVRDTALLRRLRVPRGVPTLEGYLPPGTYRFQSDATARRIVAVMVYRFESMWNAERTHRLQNLKRTRHEVVTLASIVEKEVMREAEGPLVAGVYMNRLRRKMRLQADPTVQYALRRPPGRVRHTDLRVNSPYNTYLIPGLPPGPIGAPSLSSIDAVLHFQRHEFLFFVSRGNGTHEFTRTYVDHLAAIERIRTP